jgi:hypothetical protein
MKTELARNSDSSIDNNSIVPTRRRFVPSPSLSLPQPVKSEEAVTATNIRRRVVKKEEEGEEEVYNSHDDDDDNNNMNGTENCNSLPSKVVMTRIMMIGRMETGVGCYLLMRILMIT